MESYKRHKPWPGLRKASVENELVYSKVYKQNHNNIQLPSFLGPWQCLPGPIFHPRNSNIQIGPGDEANDHVTLTKWNSPKYYVMYVMYTMAYKFTLSC